MDEVEVTQADVQAKRRLIVIAVEAGENLEVDWDGDFAYWELVGALRGAKKIVEAQEFVDTSDDEDGDV